MAVRTVTSDPQFSKRIHGFLYFYYNKKLANGGEAVALIHPSIKDIVKKGFIFDDTAIKFDTHFNASILSLDFDEPSTVDPCLPSDPEAGWGDQDDLVAVAQEQTNGHHIPNRGVRPTTVRRRQADVIREEGRLRPELVSFSDEVINIFLYTYARLSVINETARSNVAQKITATIAIPYYRSVGVNLDEEDVKSMTMI